jgi:hypothetical protein
MVPALGDALGTSSAFQVLQRKKAKAFRVQNWIMVGQLHLFAPESLVFFHQRMSRRGCSEIDPSRISRPAVEHSFMLNTQRRTTPRS